ncbi:MAG: HINT domain-containing protein [Sandaracinaceae bacterium]|nr:HINT domain-containing protein [Sandaracinaceae bacterium]
MTADELAAEARLVIARLTWVCGALVALLATPGGAFAAAMPTEVARPAHVVLERTVHAADGVMALELGPESGPTETIEATREHPLWARSSASALTASSTSRPGSGPRDGWVPAGELRPGDEIFTSTGGWIRVHGNTWISREQLVYNLDVEGADPFFVGHSGAWVRPTRSP